MPEWFQTRTEDNMTPHMRAVYDWTGAYKNQLLSSWFGAEIPEVSVPAPTKVAPAQIDSAVLEALSEPAPIAPKPQVSDGGVGFANALERLGSNQTGPKLRPTYMTQGFGLADNVPPGLVHQESSGRLNAQNNVVGHGGKRGHFGLVQFGHGRLEDVKRAGVIPANMTPEDFMADQDAQVRATNWHFSDIDRRAKRDGLDQYFGQVIGGVPITPDAIRAMSHLAGYGGMMAFINSGGKDNRADAYGTKVSDYGIKFAYRPDQRS